MSNKNKKVEITKFLKMFKLLKKKRGGFTLLELLVVVAVIGILASVILVGVAAFRGRARDSRRISDLRQLQNALELCFTRNGEYPASLADLTSATVCNVGVTQIPVDPSDESTYGYCRNAGNNRYVLGSVLEENNSVHRDMIATTFTSICPPVGTVRNGTITCQDAGANNHYCLTI